MKNANLIFKKFLNILRKALTIGTILAIILINLIVLSLDNNMTIIERILAIFLCSAIYILIQLLLYYIVYFILMKED